MPRSGIPDIPRRLPQFRFRCSACEELHAGVPNFAFRMPDEVFALPRDERARRAVATDDLVLLDDKRVFVRCVIDLAIIGTDQTFGYGPWVEVDAADYARFAVHDAAGTAPERFDIAGAVANALDGQLPDTRGVPCRVRRSESAKGRPLAIVDRSAHPIGREQADGVSVTRLLALVSARKGFLLVVE